MFMERHTEDGTRINSKDKHYKDGDHPYSLCGFKCNICLDLAQDPIVTFCGHLYCWPCIYQWIWYANPQKTQCPVCKTVVSQSTIIPLYGCSGSPTTSSSEEHSDHVPQRPQCIRDTNERVTMAMLQELQKEMMAMLQEHIAAFQEQMMDQVHIILRADREEVCRQRAEEERIREERWRAEHEDYKKKLMEFVVMHLNQNQALRLPTDTVVVPETLIAPSPTATTSCNPSIAAYQTQVLNILGATRDEEHQQRAEEESRREERLAP